MSENKNPNSPASGGHDTPKAETPSAAGFSAGRNAAQAPSEHGGKKADTPPPAKSGSGLALLALILGALGIGAGGYTYTLVQAQQAQSNKAVQQAETAVQSAAAANQTAEALKNTVAGSTQGLDKAEVSRLIADAAGEIKTQIESRPAGLTEAQVNEQISARLATLPEPQPAVSAEDIKAMIAAAVADSVQAGGNVDLSEQIDAFTASRQEAQHALELLEQRAVQLEQSLTDKAQSLSKTLQDQSAGTVNPLPLINLLNLAAVAADSGSYRSAALYLDQALNSYALFHLDQPPYAGFKSDIAAAQKACTELARKNSAVKELAALTQEVASWPLKSGSAFNEAAQKPEADPETLTGKVQHLGAKVLSKAFTVTKNDEAGLTWINANPILQNVVRENVRLDLAYARNAALIHDSQSMKNAVESVIPQIQRYFDNDAEAVRKALDILHALPSDTAETPDIRKIIDAIEKASGVQS